MANKNRKSTLGRVDNSLKERINNLNSPSDVKGKSLDENVENISNNVLISIGGLLSAIIGGSKPGKMFLSARGDSALSKVKSIIGNSGNGLLDEKTGIQVAIKQLTNNSNKILKYHEFTVKAVQDYLSMREKSLKDAFLIDFFTSHVKLQKRFYTKIFPDLLKNVNSKSRDNKVKLVLEGDKEFDNIIENLTKDKVNATNNVEAVLNIVKLLKDLEKELGGKRQINKQLKKLLELLSDDGYFVQVIEQVNKLEKKAKDTQKLINISEFLENFFRQLVFLKNIKDEEITAAIRNIKYIISDYIPEVKDLIEEINKINSVDNDRVNNIKKLITSLTGILSTMHSIKLSRIFMSSVKLSMISEVFFKFIIDITEKIKEISKNIQEYSEDKITDFLNNISNLFDYIFKNFPITRSKKVQKQLYELELVVYWISNTYFYTKSWLSDEYLDKLSFENLNNSMSSLIDILNGLKNKLDEENLNDILKALLITNDISDNIKTTGDILKTLQDISNYDFELLGDTIDQLRNVANSLGDKDNALEEIIKKFIISNEIAEKIKHTTASLEELIDIAKLLSNPILKAANTVGITALDTLVGGVEKISDKINNINIDEQKLKLIEGTLKSLLKVTVMAAAVLIVGSLAMTMINFSDLLAFTLALSVFMYSLISTITKLDQKELKISLDTMQGFSILVAVSGMTLIFGSLLMKFISLGDLLLFTVTLGGFLWGLINILDDLKNELEDAGETLKGLAWLVLAAGFTMIFGSIMMKLINIDDLLKFILGFALTMGTLVMFINSIDNDVNLSLETMAGIALLVVTVGFTMALGSLLMKFVSFADMFTFVLGFAITIGTLVLFINSIKDATQEAQKTAVALAALVLFSGAILLLAGLILSLNPMIGVWALGFAVLLGAFIWGILLAYKSASIGIKESLVISWEFALLVGISGAILLLGGYFILKNPWLALSITAFGALLWLFVTGIIWTFQWASKTAGGAKMINFIGIAAGISIITILVGGTLLFAGKMMVDNPGMAAQIAIFGVMLIGYISIMSTALGVMGSFAALIGLGLLVAVGIGLITIGFIEVFRRISAAEKDLGGLSGTKTIINFITGMFDVIWVFMNNVIKIGLLLVLPPVTLLLGGGLIMLTALVAGLIHLSLAMESLNRVKKINSGLLLSNINTIIKLVDALKPLTTSAKTIILAGLAVKTLAITLSSISEAVADYATLKIPIYEGIKKVGYKDLTTNDFKQAAKNVSLIISVLGNAVISTYNKNPQIFESNFFGNTPFGKVSRALKNLGPLIEKIASSVKNYATLKIPIYSGTKVTGYKSLSNEDFKSAAKNVQLIIETLGKTVVKSYTLHPDYYDSGLITNSPFTKVTKALGNLGPMISKIAEGVKDYADLKIVKEWIFKDGKAIPKDYIHLDDSHFKLAAKNIQHIIETLGKSVIDSYTAHPDYYASGLITNSPFTKVTKALGNLGPMISTIAKSVKDYADFKIVEEWEKNNDGKLVPKKYRHLSDYDFDKASENVQKIISTLGGAIIMAYEAHPDYYDSGIFTDSIFTKVIKANKNLSGLISSLAKAVRNYADFKIVTEWEKDKDGKLVPKDYEHLSEKHFTAAGNNIVKVISVLGNGIMKTYEEHPDWYENTGTFGFGDSIFDKVVASVTGLGEVISKIGKAVFKLSEGKIEKDWDKDGKAIAYEHLTPTHFSNASTMISQIITSLGTAIIKTYEDSNNADFFDDGEDSKFAQVCKSLSTMGNMIGDITSAVLSYATSKVPVYKDGTTEIKEYRKLEPKDYTEASKNIQKVISTIGQALIGMYTDPKYKDWFDDGEDSKFAQCIKSISGMGELVSNIAEAVKNYAEIKFPAKWDAQGNVTEYKELNKESFKEAANNIMAVVSTIGGAIIKLYDEDKAKDKDKQIFSAAIKVGAFGIVEIDNNVDTPFTRVVKSISALGNMISEISQGVSAFASSEVPLWKDGKVVGTRPLDKGDFDKAAEYIGDLVGTLGQAIIDLYDNDIMKEMIEVGDAVSYSGLGGLFKFSIKEDAKNDNRFVKVVKSVQTLGAMISAIAEGVQDFASMRVPTKWDEMGMPIEFKSVDFKNLKSEVTDNIKDILTCLGEAITKIYKDNPSLFEAPKVKVGLGPFSLFGNVEIPTSGDSPITKVLIAVSQYGKIITSLASGIQAFASMYMPTAWDSEGKPIAYGHVDDSIFKQAKKHIGEILVTIGDSINKVYHKNKNIFSSDIPIKISKALSLSSNAILRGMQAIQVYSKLEMPTVDNDGNIIGKHKLNEDDFEEVKKNISNILTVIGDQLLKFVNDPKLMRYIKSLDPIANYYLKVGTALSQIASSIKLYATMQYEEIDPNDPNKKIVQKLTSPMIIEAAGTIEEVLTCLGRAIVNTVSNNEDIFGQASNIFGTAQGIETSPAYMAAVAIGKIAEPVVKIASVIKMFSGQKYVNKETGEIIGLDDNELRKARENIANVIGTLVGCLHFIMKGSKDSEFKGIEAMLSLEASGRKVGQEAFNNIINTFSSGTAMIISIVRSAANLTKEMSEIKMDSWQSTDNSDSEKMKLIKSILDVMLLPVTDDNYNVLMFEKPEKIAELNTNILNLQTVITSIISAGKTLQNEFKDDIIKKWTDATYSTNISSSLIKIIKIFKDVLNYKEKNEDSETVLQKLANNTQIIHDLNNINNVVNSTTSCIENLIENINNISSIISELDAESFTNKVQNVVDSYIKSMNILKQILNDTNQEAEETNYLMSNDQSFMNFDIFGNNDNNIEEESKEDKLTKRINYFTDNIKKIVEIAEMASSITDEPFETIGNGITYINDKVATIVDQKLFQQHQEVLGKYVKSVNSIDLSKMSSLQKLTDSANRLSVRLGNVDKLTEAIADKLAEELNFLAKELIFAKLAIDKSEEVQEKRHEMIDKSVNSIREIMKQKLTVEIYQQSNPESETPGGNIGGTGGLANNSTPADNLGGGTSSISSNTGGGTRNGLDNNMTDQQARKTINQIIAKVWGKSAKGRPSDLQ